MAVVVVVAGACRMARAVMCVVCPWRAGGVQVSGACSGCRVYACAGASGYCEMCSQGRIAIVS